MAPEFPVRPMRPEDLTRVAELERLCNSLPWREEDLLAFAREQENSGPRNIGLVTGDRVNGYLCAAQGFGEAEILVFGVDPELRRRGLGRALLEKLLETLAGRECRTVFLEVRRGNAAAVALYLSLGFKEIGARKTYYADNGEDAMIFRRE